MICWVLFIVCVDSFRENVNNLAPYKKFHFNILPNNTSNEMESDMNLGKFKLLASPRSLANRHRKQMELWKLVKKRRLSTKERFEDLVRINIRNDKCNVTLSRLPVSPNTNLNHIVPFKTIRYLRSYEPLNPRPILRLVGYQLKEIEDPTLTSERAKAIVEAGLPLSERFDRVYPYDKRLRVEDARGMGFHSRKETKFPLTGESDEMPTPMESLKSHMKWQKDMLNPKHRPLSLKNYENYYNARVDMQSFYSTRERLLKFVDKISRVAAGIIPENILNMIKVPGNVKWSKTLDEAVDEGDLFLNPYYFGKDEYFEHPFYGNPTLPADVKKYLDEYNSTNPRTKITFDMLRCDIIYCHSNGTIMKLIENSPPYGGEADDFPDKDPWEPRFVIQAKPGYIKENNLKVGELFKQLDEKARFSFYDNYFSMPKSIRIPIRLPHGRVIRA